jgi:hypothetical protein
MVIVCEKRYLKAKVLANQHLHIDLTALAFEESVPASSASPLIPAGKAWSCSERLKSATNRNNWSPQANRVEK